MQAQRNVANILIAKSVAKTLTHSTNIDNAMANMLTGEPAVISPSGVIVNAAGTLPAEFKIVTKLTNGDLNISDIINPRYIKSINTTSYAAPTNQVDYVGYNGVSGSFDVINNNIYSVKLIILPDDIAGFMQQKIKEGFYETDSTATQREIATGLTKSLISNFSREPEKTKYGVDRIKFERINSGALADAIATATLTVSKGSKAVVFSADATAIVTVGSLLRIGGTGAGTAPVYVVTAVTGTGATAVYTLDIPYQGESEVVAHGNVETVTEGNWGIKISSSTYSYDEPKFRYSQPIWKTWTQDVGSTIVTESTRAYKGSGDWRQVDAMEALFLGNEGNYYRAQIPQPTFRKETDPTKTYAIITIEYTDGFTTELGKGVESLKQLYIACEKTTGTGYSDANTGLGVTLDAYAALYKFPINGTTSTLISA